MSQLFAIAFQIGGKLNPSLTSAIAKASSAITQLKKRNVEIKESQDIVNAMYNQGNMSIEEYCNSMSRLTSEYNKNIEVSKRLGEQLKNDKYKSAKNNFSDRWGSLMSFGTKVGVAAYALKKFTEPAIAFEDTMMRAGAISGATGSDFDALTAQARKLGETTRFTAQQAAEAMTFLGMAGWKTQDIIKGMPALLDLAIVGGTDLGKTADILSDELTAFGLGAESSNHMADVFAQTITSTNTDVLKLGDTMKYAAPVAHAFGLSLEETAAMSGLMAGAGIKASMAGTTLRAGLARLAGPPKMATKALAELGLSMEDLTAVSKEADIVLESLGIDTSKGQGTSKMGNILSQLREKMKGLSHEEQVASAKAIFGQEAFAGWLAVINSNDGSFEKLLDSIQHCDGAANKFSNRVSKTAKGAIYEFTSAIESLSISLVTSFLPSISNTLRWGAKYTGLLAAWSGKNPEIIQGIVTTGMVLTGLVGVYKVARAAQAGYNLVVTAGQFLHVKFLIGKTIMLGLSAATKIAAAAQWLFNASLYGCPIVWIIAGVIALIAVGYLLYKNWDKIKIFFEDLWTGVKIVWNEFMVWAGSKFEEIGAWILSVWEGVKSFFASLWDGAMAALANFIQGIYDKFSGAYDWVMGKWSALKALLADPIEGDVHITTYESGNPVLDHLKHNAAGGIYGQGAFVTTFAEKSREAAIPINGSRRSYNLLEQTAGLMGVKLGGGDIYAPFNPQITVSGNADVQQLSGILDAKMAEFEEMLDRVRNQERRLNFV